MNFEDEPQQQAPRASGVLVECLNCGRRSAITPEDGEEIGLVQLTKRLRCSECGSRAVKAARIETPRDVARLMRARMGSGRS